jgi:hypothetical protein
MPLPVKPPKDRLAVKRALASFLKGAVVEPFAERLFAENAAKARALFSPQELRVKHNFTALQCRMLGYSPREILLGGYPQKEVTTAFQAKLSIKPVRLQEEKKPPVSDGEELE